MASNARQTLPRNTALGGGGSVVVLVSEVWWHNLNLKAKFEGGSPYDGFKRLVPGAVNMGFIGSTCTALPRRAARA